MKHHNFIILFAQHKIKFLSLLLFFFTVESFHAQTITLSGTVQDSLGKKLEYANIIAQSDSDKKVIFAISDESGRYKLTLQKNIPYSVTVTYLGFKMTKFHIQEEKNSIRDITLYPDNEQLEAVTLDYKPPVIIKKDTIAYKVDSFLSGKERKLKDVLKKLPGVEVDDEGNVLVRGKKVTKVLVEGKVFFTGNSKLAVNNIPANAVETIVVLDNYSDVAFLKGLEDSDEMAMNIELKEDKKKFIFGEIETSGGIENRYVIHPTLYYYSPKTTVNFIGDLNNVGEKSFTLKDYIDFEGGAGKLLTDSQSYFSLYTDDFAQFLRNKDYVDSNQQFGAFNFNQDINDNYSLSSYGIFSKSKTQNKAVSRNQYIGNDDLNEIRNENSANAIRFGIGKLALSYQPNDDTEFLFDSYVKISDNEQKSSINTNSSAVHATIATDISTVNSSFKQHVQFHKRFNKSNVTSVIFDYEYAQNTPNYNWNTNETLLSNLIPIIDEDFIDIYNDKSSKNQSFNSVAKHYKVLNSNHHVYASLGNNYSREHLNTFEYQRLQNGDINSFASNNFSNRTRVSMNDFHAGVEYKFKKKILTFKAGLFYHNYSWQITQFDTNSNISRNVILPEITTHLDFSNSKKLVLKYRKRVRLPVISQLANRLTLTNFNSLYRGNEALDYQRFHNINLNFYRFSMYRDILYTISVSYRKSDQNIKNTTQIEGIDFIASPIVLENEDTFWQFGGSLRKGFKGFTISFKSNISLSDYFRPINDALINASAQNYDFNIEASTKFKKFPTVKIGVDKSFSNFTAVTNTKFENTVFFGNVEFAFLKNFMFNFDYQYENYRNKTIAERSTFNIGNTSIRYEKETLPWSFEASVTNMFNVNFKRRNTFSTLLVSDQQLFVFPRVFLLKVMYKL